MSNTKITIKSKGPQTLGDKCSYTLSNDIEMKLTLKRIFKGADYTIGKLYIDGVYFSDTIEDMVRDLPPVCPNPPRGVVCACKEKVYAETAIPAGTYRVTMEYSPRFKRALPYLHDVPHFLGILIHAGSTADSSAGCIIVGRNKIKGKVLESKATLDALLAKIGNEKSITIQII